MVAVEMIEFDYIMKENYLEVKTVLSSGMLDNEIRDEALEMGVKETVYKPYVAVELSAVMKSVIDRD